MTDILKRKYMLAVAAALEVSLLLLLFLRGYHCLNIKVLLLTFIGIPLIFILLNRPWIFIYLVPLTAFFSYSLKIGGIEINTTHTCIVLIFLSASLYLSIKTQNYVKNSLFLKPIMILSIIAIISFLFTHLRSISSLWVARGTLELGLLLLLYHVCILLINTEKRIRYLKLSLIVAGTLLSFQTLYGYSYALRFSPEKLAQAFFFFRGGTFGASPNQAAMFLELIFPIVLIYYLYAKKRLRKLVSLSLVFIIFLAVFSTFSRGAILSLSFSMILIIFLTKKFKEVLIPAASIVVFLFFSSFYLLIIARFETFAIQVSTLVGRIPLFKAAMNVIKDNWLIGIGMNNFQLLKYNYGFPYSFDLFKIKSAHNIYLEMFANLGIMGIVATLWILISSIVGIKRTVKSNEQIKASSIGLFCSITAFYLHGFMDSALANVRTMAVFVIILALFATEYSRSK